MINKYEWSTYNFMQAGTKYKIPSKSTHVSKYALKAKAC